MSSLSVKSQSLSFITTNHSLKQTAGKNFKSLEGKLSISLSVEAKMRPGCLKLRVKLSISNDYVAVFVLKNAYILFQFVPTLKCE